MKNTHVLLVAGFAAAGMMSGYAGRKLSAGETASVAEPMPVASTAAADRSRGSAPANSRSKRPTGTAPSAGHIRSTDTLESLKGLDADDLFPRLARWMIDASEEEIAAWWQHYRGLDDRSNDINDLIFINWTRLDPRAATAATAGTPDEHYAWWAWACHDPETALATVLAENPDRLNNVTWGIGEFHPEWLMKHFDEIPEEGRDNALRGLAKWDDAGDPLEILTFLRDKGHGFHQRLFKVLIRKDPWGAYDWIQENGETIPGQYGGSTDVMELFIGTVGAQHPEILEQLAEQAPPGAKKRQMEALVFKSLLARDPDAAVREAMAIEAPKIAAERLSAVALHFLNDDPDRAFEVAERLFTLNPDAMNGTTRVWFDDNSSVWGSSRDPEVSRLMNGLLDTDPERAMSLAMDAAGSEPPTATIHQLGELWANRDLNAFAEWTETQDDPTVRIHAGSVVFNGLRRAHRFEEAAGWVVGNDPHDGRLQMILSEWRGSQPDQAAAWLTTSGLPPEKVEQLKTLTGIDP